MPHQAKVKRPRFRPIEPYLVERTKTHPLEAAFLVGWQSHRQQLRDILGRPANRHEEFIAATLVQWLGTNCGFWYLQNCLTRCGLRIEGEEPRHKEPLIQEMLLALKRHQGDQLLFDLSEPH